jgi:hypothetical protein
MSRMRTLIGLGFLGTFVWKLFRRRRTTHPTYEPTYEAPYVLERRPDRKAPLLSDAGAALVDTARIGATATRKAVGLGVRGPVAATGWLRSRRRSGPDATSGEHADIDEGMVEFEWSVRTSDPQAISDALEDAGITFATREVTPDDREDEMAERLMAVGIHLDQEPSGDFIPRAIARYAGSASPRRLANAFAHVARSARTGFIVDASEAGPVLIDEHQDVGTGVLALLEPSEARLAHGEQDRAFLRAVRSAGARQQQRSSTVS